MKVYKSKVSTLSGTSYNEINSRARSLYRTYTSRTKRQPYIRSAYFRKDKIFLGLFWRHLRDKNWKDRSRRLKFLPCAFDLIKNSKQEPSSMQNPNKSGEIIHRFAGITKDGELFFVQIKEIKNTGRKYLISVFPIR